MALNDTNGLLSLTCDDCGREWDRWTDSEEYTPNTILTARQCGWVTPQKGGWYCPHCVKEHNDALPQMRKASEDDGQPAQQP